MIFITRHKDICTGYSRSETSFGGTENLYPVSYVFFRDSLRKGVSDRFEPQHTYKKIQTHIYINIRFIHVYKKQTKQQQQQKKKNLQNTAVLNMYFLMNN